ncbi:uncharacterized protein LOC119067515 isoform X2 [Bradysia coprophila]|uniref:uncharacterized protein LOC119067515 isoform X2 n=1 Tax=Bradysia coprophila TaxID=38358 RepID=UPI00187DAC21|nr:uncharacterized protein LOC119067515 isoform X2 [Bradysia coprophila]
MTESGETKLCRLCACDSIDNKNIFDESDDLLIKLRTTFSLVIFKGDELPQHLCNGCESVVVNYYDRITTYEKLEKKWLSETSGQNPIKNVYEAVEAESQKIRKAITTLLPDYPIQQKHNILAAVIKTSLSPSTDNFNVNGRSYLNTVLDYELPPISTDEDQSKIDEDSLDASRFEMSRRVKKKKRRNPLRDYIRRGKRRKIATAQTDRTTNSTPVTDTNVEKLTSTESTANTQISNEPQCSDTPPPLRKKPGPKPKSKLPPNTDEAGGCLDKEFVHWKKPGPQVAPVINENNRLRRSRRQFEHDSSKEEPVDATVVKVKRSASKDKSLENTRKVPQSASDRSVDVPNEFELTKEIKDEQRPTDTEDVIDDKADRALSGRKGKIVILNPQEVLKECDVSNEVVRSDSVTTKSNDSQSEDSDRPSSKNRKRLDEYDVPGNESKKKRQTSRINYSEALVDEALMYEEMLLNQQAKEQLFIASTIESSKQKAKTVDLGKNNFSMDYDDSDTIVKKTKLDVSLGNLGEICLSRKEKLPPRESSTSTETVQKVESVGPDVRLSEISITPISKPKSTAVKADNQINVSLTDIKKTFKSNPEIVFNISSAVSIQLKSAACSKTDQGQLSKGPSTTCQYCRKQFSDIKQLAVHQLVHLKVETHKIGSPLVLSPSFRRGRMVPMGNNKCFRCLNCWRLYPNSQSILQHWVTGKCIFYCSICGQSFHQNPKLIRDHFPEVHGIKFKMPNSSSAPATPMAPMASDSMLLATHASQRMNRAKFQEQAIKGAPASAVASTAPGRSFSVIKMKPPIGRVKCHICSCSFPNMQSRNSHMRLHKNDIHMRLHKSEKDPIKPINLRQLVSQPQRPIQMNFNNIQQRQFPNVVNRIQPNHAIGAPNRQFRMAQPVSQQRATNIREHFLHTNDHTAAGEHHSTVSIGSPIAITSAAIATNSTSISNSIRTARTKYSILQSGVGRVPAIATHSGRISVCSGTS